MTTAVARKASRTVRECFTLNNSPTSVNTVSCAYIRLTWAPLIDQLIFTSATKRHRAICLYQQRYSHPQSKLEWFWTNSNRDIGEENRGRMSQASSTAAPALSPRFCFDERLFRGMFPSGVPEPAYVNCPVSCQTSSAFHGLPLMTRLRKISML
jgi:hypothetical protein